MTATARLRGLRMIGFKSFAERTDVEFGPGISAIVGPNGSGKSNLADALRWALGEQGRSLRVRRAEDVIFAGSERRRAIGMADVTLVLDNADRLLPLDFAEVALGRRLFRSGENDYLVNRQRMRYRDVVDLLEAASLAENAFLFIGQGMVDQALSLRPEERRILFEEVAGVRRHERRRRQAEQQLAEAEANLARVRDVLAELRPQARRLALQVEQEHARRTAADDLAAALVGAAHGRWHATFHAGRDALVALEAARAAASAAQDELRSAEARAGSLAAALTERAAAERAVRATLDDVSTALTAARLDQGRAEAALEGLVRDRRRLDTERSTTEARIEVARRTAAIPVPASDPDSARELAEAEHALVAALGELTGLRAAGRAADAHEASVRRAEAARFADLEAARRYAVIANRTAGEQESRAVHADGAADAASARRRAATTAREEAASRESRAEIAEAAARDAVEVAEGLSRARLTAAADAEGRLAGLRGRLETLEQRLAAEEGLAITQAARRRGGRRVAEGLDVDPGLRGAVEAALGDAIRAAAVPSDRVPTLRGERGLVVIDDVARRIERDGDRARFAAERAGGGHLLDAVRRDPSGVASRLLGTALWAPTLESALGLVPVLPSGWSVATPSGDLVTAAGLVRLGGGVPLLEQRAEREALAADAARLAAEVVPVRAAAEEATRAAAAARSMRDAARQVVELARRDLRAAEESERAAARAAEAAVRERAWERAQAERLAAAATVAVGALAELERATERAVGEHADGSSVPGSEALAAWEQRVEEMRRRRDRLAAADQERAAERRRAEDARSRAEAALALDEARLEAIDREAAEVAVALEQAGAERERMLAEVAALGERARAARSSLDEVLAAGGGERDELARVERATAGIRERLRHLDQRVRAAEVAELESRLAREAAREQMLVELASLGDAGLVALRNEAGDGTTPSDGAAVPGADGAPARGMDRGADGDDEQADEDDPAAALERALDAAAARWDDDPSLPDAPSAARLALLRRRFHELGAGNPLAAMEYREVRTRLDMLEAQRDDLDRAIRSTRELIGELERLIADQFRFTFSALEDAFGRRFAQLFGGGVARLSLTEPEDLETTGVEITAQPPGKKRQPLAMLSGGERALTAVALLFAMLEVRPVPFCVLDEVDAALDEANVGRFTEALRELAERTQCVVITHNRGTIEAADALYGVTLGDDAVSRVVSLRLEEARSIVEASVPA